MNKIILIIIQLVVISFFSLYAQTTSVGINTNDPKGVFHIDPHGNTNSSNVTNDDVIVDQDGNIGIGKIDPTKKIDVSGNILLTGNDTIVGDITVNDYIFVRDTMRIGDTSLDNLYAPLEIIANERGKGLRIDNGSQKDNTKSYTDMIPVLTQENDTLVWRNLDAVTTIKVGKLKVGVNFSGGIKDITEDITQDDPNGGIITLTPGYWLICAGTSTAFGTGTRAGWNVYLHLRADTDNYATSISACAAPSEQAGAGVANPQLIYLHQVTAETKFKIYASTDLTSSYLTTATYGKPYFYAIKIDYQNN